MAKGVGDYTNSRPMPCVEAIRSTSVGGVGPSWELATLEEGNKKKKLNGHIGGINKRKIGY